MEISKIDDLLQDITNSNANSYSDDLKHKHLTIAALFLNIEYLKAVYDWAFMGDTATANIVASDSSDITKRFYAFPTNFLKITRIDIKIDGTNWNRCVFVDIGEIGGALGRDLDITNKFTNSEPYYTIIGNKIVILSGILAVVSGGIRYWFSEGIVGRDNSGDSITSFTADTDVPELPEPYQMGLVYYAAKLFDQKFELFSHARAMDYELEKLVKSMKEFTVSDDTPSLQSALNLDDFE